MKFRRGLIIALLIAAGLGLALRGQWPSSERAEPRAPPSVESKLEPPTALAERPSVHKTAEAPPQPATEATMGSFQEGFCAAEGDETIRITRGLSNLLHAELTRRRATATDADSEETALLTARFDPDDVSAQREQLIAAQRVAERHPDSVVPQLAIALLGKALGLADVELAALRRARVALPNDPAIGLAIALATRASPNLDEAITGLNAYLAVEEAPGLARLRARLEVQRDIQRPFTQRSRRGITLLWPPDGLSESQADELITAVDAALEDAAHLLGSKRRAELTVIVYPGRSELLAVSCVPTWAGGLFDGVLRLIVSPEPFGVKRKTMLHETLHAQLTPFVSTAPKWFHEGVAQSFAQQAQEVSHQWAVMVQNKVWIPFDSLDGSFSIFSASDAQLAYAQSLAMVEYLRDECGSHALADAAAAFQTGASTQAALAKACGRGEVTGAQLISYLERRISRVAE